MKYYKLYHNKELLSLKLSLMKDNDALIKNAERICLTENDIYKYNSCYLFSKNRKSLKQMAQDIKKSWRKELESGLNIIDKIKI